MGNDFLILDISLILIRTTNETTVCMSEDTGGQQAAHTWQVRTK